MENAARPSGTLKAKYRTAQKEEKPELEKQWIELTVKAKVMQPQFFLAAEKAFAEAPNSDKEVTDLLQGIFNSEIATDDFENAARVGQLLVDNHCGGPKNASDTGIAAYCIGDVNAADRYLSLAEKDGYCGRANQPNDKLADQGKYYLSNLDQFKKGME